MTAGAFRPCIVGATGATGARVARAAVAAGAAPVLAGRNTAALEGLAASIGGADVRQLDLDDASRLGAVIAETDAVINCVGPATLWGLPVAAAAARTERPYVDPTGEPGYVLDLVKRFDDAPRPLICAAGVSSLFGDLAAAALLVGEPADSLIVEYTIAGNRPSAGTTRSMVEILGDGAIVIRDGWPDRVLPGGAPVEVPGGRGVRFSFPDPVVIWRYAQVRRIDAYLLAPAPRIAGAALSALATLARRPRSRRALGNALDRLPELPHAGPAQVTASAHTDGRAVTLSGELNAYDFTATALVHVARAASAWTGRGGVRAASEILGDPDKAAGELGIQLQRRTT